jgi:hypothetical protein
LSFWTIFGRRFFGGRVSSGGFPGRGFLRAVFPAAAGLDGRTVADLSGRFSPGGFSGRGHGSKNGQNLVISAPTGEPKSPKTRSKNHFFSENGDCAPLFVHRNAIFV